MAYGEAGYVNTISSWKILVFPMTCFVRYLKVAPARNRWCSSRQLARDLEECTEMALCVSLASYPKTGMNTTGAAKRHCFCKKT